MENECSGRGYRAQEVELGKTKQVQKEISNGVKTKTTVSNLLLILARNVTIRNHFWTIYKIGLWILGDSVFVLLSFINTFPGGQI